MRCNPRRNTLRAFWHDYRSAAFYLITVLVRRRRPLLGNIRRGRLYPSALGTLVRVELDAVPLWCPHARVDAVALMPDHFHLILELSEADLGNRPKPVSGPSSGSVSVIVGQIKCMVTESARRGGVWAQGEPLWQRSFHDRILPDAWAVTCARRYLTLNPTRWEEHHAGR